MGTVRNGKRKEGAYPSPRRKRVADVRGEVRTFLLIGILLLAIIGFYFSFLMYIKPNEFGIKEVKIGFRRGIHKKAYKAGFHFVMPFGFQKIYRFPRDIQVLEMASKTGERSQYIRTENAARIQTNDGFFVDVDVAILYRITDPYLVFTTLGPGRLYEENGIIPKAEPILKQALGELTTEEFYNSPLRVQKALMARKLLNEELNAKGITVDQILIRYFRYSPEIQKNIEEKKLKDQLVFKNRSEAKAAAEAANLKRVIEEGKANVVVKLQEGKAYATKRNAEKELYSRKKRADADLLVKLAEAKKLELKNKALQTPGSDRMIGLKMADVLEGLEVVVLPSDGKAGLNPLDLEQTLKLFQVKQ